MLPQAFIERMRQLLGGECDAFLAGCEKEKYQALRLNPLKTSREEFLGKVPFHLTPIPWEQNGFYYTAEDAPGRHPFHEAGVYYIQEPSAQAVVPCLGVQPGERILDLCAAPGGKSTQIAGLLQGRGILIANEVHPARARILSENVERMGIRNAIVTNEMPEHLAELFAGYFDRILVDAPCSGEGMFRKIETAATEWSPENVAFCALRQDGILDCAARMLKPGGRLVYSTCTFAPLENEGSVSRFLHRHEEFHILPVEHSWGFAPGRPEWCEAPAEHIAGTIRLWPHLIKGEGHYLAVMEKEGILDDTEIYGLNGLQRGIAEKDCGEFPAFAGENLHVQLSGVYLRFGDQLYLGPDRMPALEHLKCLRPGLHLGTMKKNRFEPSHALALALKPAEAVNTYALAAESEDTAAYLRGQTFASGDRKGWHVITVDGYSLGWGKAAGGIMKNHYPRGLRR